jgi:4a-hydroxytetrahydrobiopterin dehydratase
VHPEDVASYTEDFSRALRQRTPFHAEARDHHPTIQNTYNKVTISLTSHDTGNKVTERDVTLARDIEAFSWV